MKCARVNDTVPPLVCSLSHLIGCRLGRAHDDIVAPPVRECRQARTFGCVDSDGVSIGWRVDEVDKGLSQAPAPRSSRAVISAACHDDGKSS